MEDFGLDILRTGKIVRRIRSRSRRRYKFLQERVPKRKKKKSRWSLSPTPPPRTLAPPWQGDNCSLQPSDYGSPLVATQDKVALSELKLRRL